MAKVAGGRWREGVGADDVGSLVSPAGVSAWRRSYPLHSTLSASLSTQSTLSNPPQITLQCAMLNTAIRHPRAFALDFEKCSRPTSACKPGARRSNGFVSTYCSCGEQNGGSRFAVRGLHSGSATIFWLRSGPHGCPANYATAIIPAAHLKSARATTSHPIAGAAVQNPETGKVAPCLRRTLTSRRPLSRASRRPMVL